MHSSRQNTKLLLLEIKTRKSQGNTHLTVFSFIIVKTKFSISLGAAVSGSGMIAPSGDWSRKLSCSFFGVINEGESWRSNICPSELWDWILPNTPVEASFTFTYIFTNIDLALIHVLKIKSLQGRTCDLNGDVELWSMTVSSHKWEGSFFLWKGYCTNSAASMTEPVSHRVINVHRFRFQF